MIAIALAVLRRVPRSAWFAVALIVTLVGGAFLLYHSGRTAGHRAAEQEFASVKTAADTRIVVHYDTVVQHDTMRLTRVTQRFDTLRVQLDVHDTIKVREFVAAADSTVRQCEITVQHLALSCAAKDTVIADLRHQLTLGAPPVVSGITWRQRAGYVALGALLGAVTARH